MSHQRTLWSDIRDHWVNVLLVAIVVALIIVVGCLDDPEYYGPGNVCPINQPTNCN